SISATFSTRRVSASVRLLCHGTISNGPWSRSIAARSSAADLSSAAVNTPARFALLVAVFVGELTQRPSASRSVNLFIVAPSTPELRLHARADRHHLVQLVILLHGEQRVPRGVELFRRLDGRFRRERRARPVPREQ